MTYGLTGVTVRFGRTVALDEVSLPVPAGRVTMVVGGDGAGKTTLMRAMVGEVTIAAGGVSAPGPADIGYLPSSSGSWADLTVQQNLQFVGQTYGIAGAALAARCEDLLDRAGLAEARHRTARQLSGGMRRKLGFCLAMLHRPPLLVLDEPSTGVDPVSRVDLWRMISEAAAGGTAVIMSTTYLDEAERAAAILVLDRGVALLSGPPDEVLAAAPGTVTRVREPVRPAFAWRRGREFHEWWPDGEAPSAGEPVLADLEDVVIAASLADGKQVAP